MQVLRGLNRVWHAPSWWVESREREKGSTDTRHGKTVSGGRLYPAMVSRDEIDTSVPSWVPSTWDPVDVARVFRTSVKHRRRSAQTRIMIFVEWEKHIGWRALTHWIDAQSRDGPERLALGIQAAFERVVANYPNRFGEMIAIVDLRTKEEVAAGRPIAVKRKKRKRTRDGKQTRSSKPRKRPKTPRKKTRASRKKVRGNKKSARKTANRRVVRIRKRKRR